MSDLTQTFNPTHSGLLAAVPEHVTDIMDEIQSMVGNAIRVMFFNEIQNRHIQISGFIVLPVPNFLAITLFSSDTDFSDKTNNQKKVDAFVQMLANKLGDRALIDDSYDQLTLTASPKDLASVLIEDAKNKMSKEVADEACTYMARALDAHRLI